MNGQMSLQRRLLWISLLPSVVVGLLLVSYFTVTGLRTLDGELHARGQALARYLAPISEYGIISGQFDSIQSLTQAMVQEHGVKAAIVVNQAGRTLAVAGRVSLSAETLRAPLPAAALVADEAHWLAYGAPVYRSVHRETDAALDALLPEVGGTAESIGRVFVEVDKEELIQRQETLMMRGLAMVGAVLLAIAALAIGIADALVRPIQHLVEGIRALSDGRFSMRVEGDSPGEIGVLAEGFNEMAGRLAEMHDSLKDRIAEATEQLVFQARHDPLTGLLNRREFDSRLEKGLAAIQAGGEPGVVLFIDLDRFKPVNDSCGHRAGDELLRQIAGLLAGRLRAGDTLARLGGDEFGVFMPHCTARFGEETAEALCALVAGHRFVWDGAIFAVGASIGLAVVDRHMRSINHVLGAADTACTRAKTLGRNRVCRETAGEGASSRQPLGAWPTRIQSALAEQRILIDVLPVRPLGETRDKPPLIEISARLHEPGQAHVALPALADAAERYDLAPLLDHYLLAATARLLAECRRAGRPVCCLLPVSIQTLQRPEAPGQIADALAAAGVSGQGLCLMLGEEAAARHAGVLMQLATQLAPQGIRLALDDFGGGLSSFSQLRTLAPAYVKLSRSLIHNLQGNRASQALLRAVQEIGADVGVETIAEGVDELALLGLLSELRLQYARGEVAGPREPLAEWLAGVVWRGRAP